MGEFQSVQIKGQEDNIRRIISEFRGGLLNVTPECAVIYGHPKSGKSTVLHATMQRLQSLAKKQEGYKLTIYSINCEELKTLHDFYFEVLEQQGNKQAATIPPKKRKYTPYSWLRRELKEKLEQIGTDLAVFALDDVDSLNNPAEILEDILGFRNSVSDAVVGFVATSNQYNLLNEFYVWENKYLPTEVTINHPPKDVYKEILYDHAEVTFSNGEKALQNVTETDLEKLHNGFEVGKAINIIDRALKIAKSRDASEIDSKDIDDAIVDVETQFGVNWLLDVNLDIHNQGILLALAKMDDSDFPTRLHPLYDDYTTILTKTDVEPLSYRRFRDRVTEALIEFVEVEKYNKGSRGGVYFEVELEAFPEAVFVALNDDAYSDLPEEVIPTRGEVVFEEFASPHP